MKTSSMMATNPAALDDTDRNAVMGVGAPSYVSGAHVWNGTADTLNAKPATTNTMASVTIGIDWPVEMVLPMSTSKVLPVTPNSSDIPYSITPDANTPSR